MIPYVAWLKTKKEAISFKYPEYLSSPNFAERAIQISQEQVKERMNAVLQYKSTILPNKPTAVISYHTICDRNPTSDDPQGFIDESFTKDTVNK